MEAAQPTQPAQQVHASTDPQKGSHPRHAVATLAHRTDKADLLQWCLRWKELSQNEKCSSMAA